MSAIDKSPFTPKEHKNHTNGVPCGCWIGNSDSIACRYCGACYELKEVLSFLVFRCYDCGSSVRPGGATLLIDSAQQSEIGKQS